MKQRLLLIIGLVALLGIIAAGIVMGTNKASLEDQQRFERLAQLTMERNVQATQNIVDWSCACADDRGEDAPECSDGPLISDDELERTKSCIIDAAAGIDADIPPGLDDFLDCLDGHFDAVDECIHRLEDDDQCSGEGSLLWLECSVALRVHQCGDTDDETHQWLEQLAHRFEDQDCAHELLANLEGPSFDRPPADMDLDLDVDLRSSRIDISDAAISVNNRTVIELSRGQLDDHRPSSIDDGLQALTNALDDLDEFDRFSVHASALIPYDTMTHVLYTVTSYPGIPTSTDIETSPPESAAYERQYIPLEDRDPLADLDDQQPDPEVTPLSITVGDGGFVLRGLDTTIEPLEGCKGSHWTICLLDGDSDPAALFEQARTAASEGDHQRAAQYYAEALERYDFRRLYNLANRLHDNHRHPGSLRLGADSDLPVGLVEIAAQVAGYRLAEAHYDDLDAFQKAFEKGPATAPLFSYPAFSVVY